MQLMHTLVGTRARSLEMPPASEEVIPGVLWGRFDVLFTAAFWKGQTWQAEAHGHYSQFQLGRTLIEETAACLLGGYGMPAEIGLAAFAALKAKGLLEPGTTASDLECVLRAPLEIGGRQRRYRFPAQKALSLAACLEGLRNYAEPTDDVVFRDELTRLRGIGPKTASWIVRNRRLSDRVAILDIHILKAGRLMGLFGRGDDPARDYRGIEQRFIKFADALGVGASLLDAVMWDIMRKLSREADEPSPLSPPGAFASMTQQLPPRS